MPNIEQFFNESNLIKQYVYKVPNYKPVYINKKLFEQIYKVPYVFETASKLISDDFSISIQKEESKNFGFADLQEDPFEIALSGNLGSGRAFFYKDIYNIKGIKTSLATSKNEIYSNGNFSLAAALKEAVIANIISNDFYEFPSYKTLAILYKGETYIFKEQLLTNDNKIETEEYNSPCAIEIRVYENNELYRISNIFINKDIITQDMLDKACEDFAKLEAKKYIEKFLHGSWSTGNISLKGNMIDFDTSAFLHGRNPQFSNTNKYIDNYFGFEYNGQIKILEKIADVYKLAFNQDDFMVHYDKYLRIYFADLIGLNKKYYDIYKEEIDDLFDLFFEMSKYYSNIKGSFIYEEESNSAAIYDFSLFFQKYLFCKQYNEDIVVGISLLLNEIKTNDDCAQLTIDKNKEYFLKYIVDDYKLIYNKMKKFIISYDRLFNVILNDDNKNEILLKQFIKNEDRYFISGENNIYDVLSDNYYYKKMDEYSINEIMNAIIDCNLRKDDYKIKFNLRIFNEFIIYFVLDNLNFSVKIIPINNYKVKFAKLSIGNEEFCFSHKSGYLVSECVKISKIREIKINDINILINAECEITY